jgi:hypothetical protein
MRNFMQKWFPWFASIAVVVSIALIGITMEEATKAGAVCWYPYPAFALLTGSIFAANSFLYRDEQG